MNLRRLDVRDNFLSELERYGYYKTCDFTLALMRWSSPVSGYGTPYKRIQWLYPQCWRRIYDAELVDGAVMLKAERRLGETRKRLDKDKAEDLFRRAESGSVFVSYDGKVRQVCEVRGEGIPVDTFCFDAFMTRKDDAAFRAFYAEVASHPRG